MKYAFRIDLEVPDEAPENVAKQILDGFASVNQELVAECREHFGGLIEASFHRVVYDELAEDQG